MKPFKSVLSIALLCMLLFTACAKAEPAKLPEELVSAAEPAPEPTPVSEPEPQPEPEPELEPEPKPVPEPTLRPDPQTETDDSGESLWGFPIDDEHYAFEVPTGGELGTVLVTVEEGEMQDYEGELFFSAWRQDDLTSPIQTWETMGGECRMHERLDVNFDGYTDFVYSQALGIVNITYDMYLWDEENKQFIYVHDPFYYGHGAGITPDEENKILTTYARESAASGIHKYFKIEDNVAIGIRRIEFHYPEHPDDTHYEQLFTVEDMIEGKLTEVYRRAFTGLNSEYKHPTEEAWEELKPWFDINYHGEE